MVKFQEQDEYEKLDRLIRTLAEKHGLALLVQGWTRKTYDVLREDRRAQTSKKLVRIESFATTSGEIRVLDDDGLAFAQELGAGLEEAFGLSEAVLIRE